MTKIIWIDTETTGTNPYIHDIIQLSGMIEIDGKMVDGFNYRCRPINVEAIEDKALQITRLTKDEIMQYKPFYKAKLCLEKIMSQHVNKYAPNDKYYIAGYNVKFDADMLRNMYLKVNDKYYGSWFYSVGLDVMQIAQWIHIKYKPMKLKNHKLSTLCKAYDIDIKAHDAMSDIKATRELYLKITKQIQCVNTTHEI